MIETAYELTQLRGWRCILFGVLPHDQWVTLHTLLLHFGRILTGSDSGQSRPQLEIPDILKTLAVRKVDLNAFIFHRGWLPETNNLISGMRIGKAIHAVLKLH